jgi:hypothetical protein
MRVLLLLACVALSACASPLWVNPKNPGADLQADLAACERDAERLARLGELANNSTIRGGCTGPACAALTENQRFQAETEAFGAKKRCMAARGWRQ